MTSPPSGTIVVSTHLQQYLFTREPDGRMSKLLGVMDALNKRYGRDRVRLAGAGYDSSWHHGFRPSVRRIGRKY